VIDPQRFVARWIYPEEIREIVEDLRGRYPVCKKLPVDIVVFAEHGLGLEFEFEPIQELGQDALLRGDLARIILDRDAFKEARSNRVRFSVAIELGHLHLHKGHLRAGEVSAPRGLGGLLCSRAG
jgi:hypothetical protein